MGSMIRSLFIACISILLFQCTEKVDQKTPIVQNDSIPVTIDTSKDIQTVDSIVPKVLDTIPNSIDTSQQNQVLDSSVLLHKTQFPMPSGRVVNILITGIDSRLGQKSARADANHIVRFFLDSGQIEIISIPRGTFAMIRKGDTTGGNIIANVRSIYGQERYIKEVKKIAGISSIDYYIEFGFSQAMGIIELLGYDDNSASTLRVLRSRKAFATGDHQRSYNQGQFIRQAILKVFDRTDEMLGQIGIRAALALASTNLSYDATSYILSELKNHGFSSASSQKIWVRMKPNYLASMKLFNFDSSNVHTIEKQIEKKVKYMIADSSRKTPAGYERRIKHLVKKVSADTAKSPIRVINALAFPYKQKSWLQIKDKSERLIVRNSICNMLIQAYNKTGKFNESKEIIDFIELDNKVRTIK
jgi:anionic cell wall polymer biosynthesis LytR-Cps2A-Psr (LCP) family protein